MTEVTAVAASWTEVTLGGAVNITVQNQGIGNLYVHVSQTVPDSLTKPKLILANLDREMLADLDAGDRVWLLSEQNSVKVMIWK